MILREIVSDNLVELENRRRSFPLTEVRKAALEQAPALDLAAVLQSDRVRLIAEIKRASPSRGIIRPHLDPVEIAKVYASNGASAISVLTEAKHFHGSLQDLRAIRDALEDCGNARPAGVSEEVQNASCRGSGEAVSKRVQGQVPAEGLGVSPNLILSPRVGARGLKVGPRTIPLLRKDFLFDPYHIYESRAYGADALLLIVAILTPDKLKELLLLSHQLGMRCLLEVHSEAELATALRTEARIIGINNRDLDSFRVDLSTTKRLRPFVPPDRIVVSESGISSRADVEMLRHLRVDAILVGEALMSAEDIAMKMKELL